MTAVADHGSPPEEKKRSFRPRGPLGENVAGTIGLLQDRLLAERARPEAVAALAKLRRAIGREPGFDYTLDRYLAVPESLLGNRVSFDEATDAEHAKHAAVTHYALHQQSQAQKMHVDGRGLGVAVGDLARKSKLPDGVRRRFAALGTAISYEETLYHLRSLIVMLREHGIPLDYGLLAHDLAVLRQPGGRARMQAAWGREFFRSAPSESENDSETSHEPINETDPEETMP